MPTRKLMFLVHRSLPAALAAWCVVLASTSAWAEPIRWEFSGRSTATTQSRFTGLPELFPVGSDVTVGLTYDSDMLPTVEPPGQAEYQFRTEWPSFDFNLRIGDYEYAWSRQGLVTLRVSAAGLYFDGFLSQRAVAGKPIGTSDLWYPEVFEFSVPFAATSNALPTLLPGTLSGSTFSFGLQAYGEECYLRGCGTTGYVTGDLTSVERVPSPSALLLFGIGLTGTALWRRTRGRSARV